MPSRTSQAPRVAVLADSDTRWKWGALTARRIAEDEAELTGFLLRGRATPTARQLAEVGVDADELREVTGVEFLHAIRDEGYDLVVLALVGGAVQAMLHGLAALRLPRRPVLVTGYVGVVYEKLADGLLLRHGADVVLANSRHDADRFRAVYEGVGADASSVTEAALPFLGGAPYARQEGRDTVVFAVQPSVPESRADRTYLLRRLVEHARLHPSREVLLKLRSKPGEHTTHLEEVPYQKLADRLPGGLPPNFSLVYGHMGEVLDRTDLLVTVSSTAALEALHRRIPTAVLTDLGVREALGNHHFLGSGLLTSWDRLDGGHRPEPDEEWLARQGVAADGAYETAFEEARKRVAELLSQPELPPVTPYYTPATAPGYLPGILARHRLAADGTPLAGAAPAAEVTGVRRVVRDAVRGAARGAYRHGVQRVAPVIRRMGEL
ncbi:hypothetical protein OHA27_21385 [Streptomyces sp. NBC_01619]|uniref:DUF6716 putative glycosyltransferase n=1 Tax=unclassified Streptomyces TaxID=2593676 RepID=UPI00225018C7|nr:MULTISPECIES: DUF6716 putative glycosyltransferase [unclassified Streptomyces]MCX4512810.1 hypothetical protein [Streptomyces sp. NBC_01619]